MKFKFCLFASAILSSSYAIAIEDSAGRNFIAETPDAIVCTIDGVNAERYIYYKHVVSESHIVRYDGPNGYLLQYDLPSGNLLMGSSWNPRPSSSDCVQEQLTIGELINLKKAYKMLVPMPSGSIVTTH